MQSTAVEYDSGETGYLTTLYIELQTISVAEIYLIPSRSQLHSGSPNQILGYVAVAL